MKKFRRISVFLLSLLMMFTVSACSDAPAQVEKANQAENPIKMEAAVQSSSESTEESTTQESLTKLAVPAAKNNSEQNRTNESKTSESTAATKKERSSEQSNPESKQREIQEEYFITTYDVNMRSGPGTEFDIVTLLPAYTSLKSVGPAESGWIPVNADGIEGYIRQDLLQVQEETETNLNNALVQNDYDSEQENIAYAESAVANAVALAGPAVDENQAQYEEVPAEEVYIENNVNAFMSNDVAVEVDNYVDVNIYEEVAVEEYSEEWSEEVNALADQVGADTVYITNSGSKYHNSWCSHLKNSAIPISLTDALAAGYEACKTCH